MGIKQQYRIRPPGHETREREAFASYSIDLVNTLWVGQAQTTPVRSNVNHIDGNDLFSVENTAKVFEAALSKREKKERV